MLANGVEGFRQFVPSLLNAVATGLGVGSPLDGSTGNGGLERGVQVSVGLIGANQFAAAIDQQSPRVAQKGGDLEIGAAVGFDHAAHYHTAALERFAQGLADGLGVHLLRVGLASEEAAPKSKPSSIPHFAIELAPAIPENLWLTAPVDCWMVIGCRHKLRNRLQVM